MSIIYKTFYQLHNFSQKTPITIDATDCYAIVPTHTNNSLIQKVYGFAYWAFPILLTYGCAKALQLKTIAKIGLTLLPVFYSLLHRFAPVMILPGPIVSMEEKKRLRTNKMALLSENEQEKDWEVLNFSLKVNGMKIDGILVRKKDAQTKRWVL